MSPKNVRETSTERVVNIGKEGGRFEKEEKIENFDINLPTEHRAYQSKSRCKSSERASLLALPEAFEPLQQDTSELMGDKSKKESINPTPSVVLNKERASRTSKKFGYTPSDQVSEDMNKARPKEENAQIESYRSDSTERVSLLCNKVGFDPLELSAMNIDDGGLISKIASVSQEMKK